VARVVANASHEVIFETHERLELAMRDALETLGQHCRKPLVIDENGFHIAFSIPAPPPTATSAPISGVFSFINHTTPELLTVIRAESQQATGRVAMRAFDCFTARRRIRFFRACLSAP